MEATADRSVSELEAELGSHLRARRVDAGLRQADLADRANISVATLSHLEAGKGANLTTLVKVVRALDAADWIDHLAPAPRFSPLAVVEQTAREARHGSSGPRRVRARTQAT